MRAAWILAAVLFALVCLHGKQQRDGNRALILKCGGNLTHDRVEYASWDGGKLVAVTCNDGRRFKR